MQILEDLRLIASRTEGPLTTAAYDHGRWCLYAETNAMGRPRALAAATTATARFGTWTAALEAAGLNDRRWTPLSQTPTWRGELGRWRTRLSDQQILDDLRYAAAGIEGEITSGSYKRERWRTYLETRTQRQPRVLAGLSSVYRHFGSWAGAIRAANLS